MSKEEELINPGLTAMFIVRIEDVTDIMRAAKEEGEEAAKAQREALVERVNGILKDEFEISNRKLSMSDAKRNVNHAIKNL